MKTIGIFVLLLIIIPFSYAEDWETYNLIEHLLSLRGPGAPEFFENAVIFTAPSNLRRVGVAFAHENFYKVYWFRQLMVSQDPLGAPIPPGSKIPDHYKDSGVQFHIYQVPENIKELEYRMIINGLWTIDPANFKTRKDPVSGLILSVLNLPQKPKNLNPFKNLSEGGSGEGLIFSFNGPPGETVTVAGNFNGWDPFMYELKERPEGVYTINIPLPPGTYQYVFFHKGRRFVDPNNPNRIYARNGSAASVIEIP
jgi:hypothetical protein